MPAGPGAAAPTAEEVRRGLLRGMVLPVAVLWIVTVGTGMLLVDVIGIDEHALSQAAVEMRTATLDGVTSALSFMADTQVVIVTAVVITGVVWWGTRHWWFAAVPVIALSLEALVFITAATVVGRDRPEVEQLDHAPPTSSFPSGHTGAATSVYLSFALMAARIRNGAVRVIVIVVVSLVPVAVAVARVYRGMHHPTDVLAGLVVGATCALIAWTWLPSSQTRDDNALEPVPAARNRVGDSHPTDP